MATDVPPGTNAFYVVAIDSLGNPVQSGIINVFVQSVGVTMLTPFDGTTYLNTNPITATAWGYLPNGSITHVEFFVNGQKFVCAGCSNVQGCAAEAADYLYQLCQ